jgi:signal transduction histidine kinase
VAAAVAFPVAVLLAVLLARSIARPVHQLTVASQRLSEGSFDIDVQTGRQDEIGRLSDAFATMAGRVGTTQSQMRQLVANVSHDLKTPLTSILGFARALSSGAAVDEAEARHMGAVIEEEAGRLSARLNDLLYLSEMDAGRALVDWADVDVSRLIESVAARVVAPGDTRWRPAELEVGLVAPADGPKLERVVENLLSNAVKFTPDGGQIRVRAFSQEGSARAVVEVANTAPGTEQADLPRLFERFYRGDRARAATSGSGLGLAIARDLARLMGGELEATLDGGVLVMRLGLRAAPDAVH